MEKLIILPSNEAMSIPFQLTPFFLLLCGIIILVAFITANIIGGYCAKRWHGDQAKVKAICQLIMTVTVVAFLLRFKVSMLTLQALVYCGVCLFSSYSDLKTRSLDDCAHCVVLAAAFMGRTLYDIPAMAIAGVTVGGIMLLVCVISKGQGVGGADIKFATASSMMVGLQSSLIGTMVGLLISVIVTAIKNKRSGKKEGFPLVPYLAIGYMSVLFLMS